MNLSGASTSVSNTATVKVNGLEVLAGEKLSRLCRP